MASKIVEKMIILQMFLWVIPMFPVSIVLVPFLLPSKSLLPSLQISEVNIEYYFIFLNSPEVAKGKTFWVVGVIE